MTEKPESNQKLPRLYKIALGVSLALNLAVAGLIGGAALRFGEDARGGLRSAGLGAYGLPYMLALPKEERRQVMKAVRSDHKGPVPDRAARRALYAAVLSDLRAEPFDIEALSGALNTQAETTIAVQKSAQTAWLAVVAQMSDSERAAYADDIEDVLRRGPRRKK
ncbi:MAG: periplasmic heavy metal sensor [Paracoccaceae bacterium]|nr:periplasmic heavy metal sensor [Paracoccaceae bacterium]